MGPDRVAGFEGDFVMRVEAAGGRPDRLVDSQLPLRTVNEAGERELVDLDLRRDDAGGFVAESGPVDVRLGAGLVEGLQLGPVVVRPEGRVPGVLLDSDTLTYANTVEDTDLAVNLTPTGLQLYASLRSELSPEQHRVALDLPAGSQLRATADGGAEIVSGGEQKLSISPPVAVDSDGEPVPVSYRVEGSELVLVVEHRDADLLYPLLVDPEFQVVEDSACKGSPSCVHTWFHGWQPALDNLGFWDWYTDFAPAPYGQDTFAHNKRCINDYGLNNCYGPAHGGGSNWNLGGGPRGTDSVGETGLHVIVRPNVFYDAYKLGEYYYLPPGNTTRVYRTDFGAKFLRMRSANRNLVMFTGIWSYPLGNWAAGQQHDGDEDGYNDGNLTHDWSTLFGSGQPGPQAVAFGMINVANGPDYVGQWRDGYLGATIIHLTDPEAPTIQTIGRSGPTGWTRDGSYTFAPRATDPGLGIRRLRLFVPLENGQTSTHDRGPYCDGTRRLPCDPTSPSPTATGTSPPSRSAPPTAAPAPATSRSPKARSRSPSPPQTRSPAPATTARPPPPSKSTAPDPRSARSRAR